jgi:hypothetical protein
VARVAQAERALSHGDYTERTRMYIPKLGSVPIVSMRKAHVMQRRDEQATKIRRDYRERKHDVPFVGILVLRRS